MHANASNCIKTTDHKVLPNNSTGIFKVDVLNVRTGYGKKFCIKRVLRNVKGKTVQTLGSHNGWFLASIEDEQLWVHQSLIIIETIPSINLEPI